LNTSVAAATDDELDVMFAALADRTRRAMVAHLAEGDRTVNELAEPFAISLQAVSKHIQVLERAGLVSRRRDRQRRPCHLEVDRLAPTADWIARSREIWTDRLDKLELHLQRLQARTGPGSAQNHDNDNDNDKGRAR
jgi:DNA-binding transcriptional ArsR family regulator